MDENRGQGILPCKRSSRHHSKDIYPYSVRTANHGANSSRAAIPCAIQHMGKRMEPGMKLDDKVCPQCKKKFLSITGKEKFCGRNCEEQV